jgi:hypothetical protein
MFRYPVLLQSIATYLLQSHGKPRSLTAKEIGILRDYADLIVEGVQDEWPVDTGTSRDAWGYELHVHYPQIGFDLENDADHVTFVHRKGETSPLYEALIPEVVTRYADDMRLELMAAINAEEVNRRQKEARRLEASRRPVAPATMGRR